MKPQISLELLFSDDTKLLYKHINLLKSIARTGSITAAAKEQNISYKNAWDSLDMLSNRSPKPLIVRASGNKKNSGSGLSDYAKELITTYDAILRVQKIFLDELCCSNDFDATLAQNLQKLSMKLSARNQLLVKITEITSGPVSTEVSAELSNGAKMRASITTQSASELDLRPGKEVLFIFKAPSVSLKNGAQTADISPHNQLTGEVTQTRPGSFNTEVTIAITGHQKVVATITNEAAAQMGIGPGDPITATIKTSDIIIGA